MTASHALSQLSYSPKNRPQGNKSPNVCQPLFVCHRNRIFIPGDCRWAASQIPVGCEDAVIESIRCRSCGIFELLTNARIENIISFVYS
jgi:hypothetical protein